MNKPYDYKEDPEYLEYLEREKRESHTHYGDDYMNNPNLNAEEESQ